MGLLRKIRSKLFLKISIIFIVSLVSILVSTILIHRTFFRPRRLPGFVRSLVHHAHYMVRDIGVPPNLEKAEEISRGMKVPIRIRYGETHWESETGFWDFSKEDLTRYTELKGYSMGFTDHGITVQYESPGYQVMIVILKKREGFRRFLNSLVMTLLSFAVLVIVVLYFFIRWLLKPVKVLKLGVDEVSGGNLDVAMPVRSSDELGKLTGSFNSMTRRIDEMLKSRDQLLRDVSHELRSPLTRIKVGMELMDDSPSRTGIMDDIAEVEAMISELLETDRLNSRFGKLYPQEIDIRELILEVMMEFKTISPGMEWGDFPEMVRIPLDRDRVRILFRNILSNALRYSDEDGEPVKISCFREDDKVIINICDSGIGIPEDELPFIFEPFYRVDKSRSRETGGYGLGMSLSKNIMEAHNGSIEISSTPGKGTCVTLTFPAG